MSRKLRCCENCGRSFRPEPHNEDRQKFCKFRDCILERKRQRQRIWYARKRAREAAFRASENTRCRDANRRRRDAERAAVAAGQKPGSLSADLLPNVVTGLIAQLTDTTDPVHLDASIRSYADRGRRLAHRVPEPAKPP